MLLMKNIACYIFWKFWGVFLSYFPHQMKFRELLGREKKISVFNFLFLMIHIFFTSPLLPADKIQQIKIIETALLLQSNISTVTGIKLSFGISLQQWRLLYMSVSEKTASAASTPAGRTQGKHQFAVPKKQNKMSFPPCASALLLSIPVFHTIHSTHLDCVKFTGFLLIGRI